MKKLLSCDCFLFAIGGILYGLVEILWRSYTHWSMVITGGVCFTVLYRIFKKITLCSLWLKCFIGSCTITSIEFLAGYIFNIRMKLKVWDYSKQPFNFRGQICPLYSFLWGILTLPILGLCGFINKKFHL